MRLIVAAREDGELAERVRQMAAALPAGAGPRQLSPEHSAMQLRRCGTPADFDARSLELLRHLVALDPRLPLPPAAAGLRARVLGTVRRTLWRLLGGPLDRLALQQTRINELLLDAIRRMSLRDDSPQPPPPAPLS